MKKEDIQNLLNATPFAPFRVHLSDGQSYDVDHPDQVLVLGHKIIIGVGYQGPHTFESEVHCSLLHITRLDQTPAG